MERNQRSISKLCLFYIFILTSSLGRASSTVTESFNSSTNKDNVNTEMVWNTALGYLHPPLLVLGYDSGSGATNFYFDVGDGSDGSFSSSADYGALTCTSIVGSTIYLDTDICADLQFTSFYLLSGWTLSPIGSKPLTIRSQSTVTIAGTIDCNGANGAAGNNDSTSTNSGGSARCGGGAGGTSVLPGVAPALINRGTSGGGATVGGGGGPVQDINGGAGGGGGGAFVKSFAGGADSPDGTSGLDGASAAVGNVGTNQRDDAFVASLSGGGSGGGGGSGYQSGASAANSSGGSGGAGGGNIQIYAVGNVNINAGGVITANGGDGGSVANPYMAGAGGGGGGGSILIMTAGDIINEGTVEAKAGSGATAFTGANGGNGYWGRTWLVEKDGYAGGSQIESPDTKLNSPGDVRYETGVTYTVTSKAIDLLNTKPTLISAAASTLNLGASTLSFQVAFGDSATDTSLSSFALPATYIGSELGRFGKFKIQVDNTSGTTPVTITDVAFTYDGFMQTEFDFEGGCGAVGVSGDAGKPPFIWILLLILPLFVFFQLRRVS